MNADLFTEHEAKYSAQVMYNTWGHLEPESGKWYQGTMILAYAETGDMVVVWSDFELPSSPGLFMDMQEYLGSLVDKGKIDNGQVLKWTGRYKRHKTTEGCAFVGKLEKLFCPPNS